MTTAARRVPSDQCASLCTKWTNLRPVLDCIRAISVRLQQDFGFSDSLIRDQEVEGSNPFAPTTAHWSNNLRHAKKRKTTWVRDLEPSRSALKPDLQPRPRVTEKHYHNFPTQYQALVSQECS